ncbi:MAG: apolipoprotein N-acyltransferase [Bdellovibrionaceae bacterium]|nr:apolipoprotein N-acyltransferase [Pseudobdellovibrionaceae bacterium]
MLSAYRLPILAGLFIGTSYIPFPPWALFFCLVPLWIFALQFATEQTPHEEKSADLKRVFFGGWLTQFILNAIGFHWIAYTAVEFGHLPWWVGGLVLFAFCALAHLYFPASLAVGVFLMRRFSLTPVASVFLFAALFAFCEMVFPVLFPWHLGYPWLWAGLPAVQMTDIIGFQGLNVVTIATNAALTLAWQRRRTHRRQALHWAVGALATFLVLNAAGMWRKQAWDQTDAEIKALAVQGNIGNFEKIMAEKGRAFHEAIVGRYLALSRAGLDQHPDADLVLWPETAFPDFLDDTFRSRPHARSVREFVKITQKPLLTGGYSRSLDKPTTYNGIFLLDPTHDELPLPPYRKTILLAFGEYFPGADWFPFVMKFFPELSAFGRGDGPISMNWGGWRLGPQICYESLYPSFSRDLAKAGAEVFVNVTNDSWFGHTFEPRQHLYMTFARALEFRRPLIRVTNTGITSAILANGEILQQSPLHQEWTGLFRVPYRRNPPHTFYESLEPTWPFLMLAAIFLLVSFGSSRRKTP